MMCAFMTPVLKNDWEVYNTKRSRNSSESSQKSLPNSRSDANNLRRRVLSESRSMSYHMGAHQKPDGEFAFLKHPPRAYHLSTRNSRNASRASFSHSNSGCTSPTKNTSKSNSHRRSSSSSSLTKFHSKVMDKLRNVLHLKDKDDESKVSEGCPPDEVTEVRSNP